MVDATKLTAFVEKLKPMADDAVMASRSLLVPKTDAAYAFKEQTPPNNHRHSSKNKKTDPDVDLSARRVNVTQATPKPSGILDQFDAYFLPKIETGMHWAGMGQLGADLLLPAVGGVAGFVGLTSVRNTLNKPYELLNGKLDERDKTGKTFEKDPIKIGSWSLGKVLMDGTMLGFQALGTYGVARGFFQKIDSLKQMYADMTGKDVKSISTWDLVIGSKKLPALVADARSHIIKEHGVRGLMQALGWGMMAYDLRKHGHIGLASMMVPQFASMGADVVMGESPVMHVYKGVSDAFKAGEKLPPQAYEEFVFAASDEIRKRGTLGRLVAVEMSKQYAAEKASPADILKEIEASLTVKKEGGHAKFDDRIASVIKTAESVYAAHVEARKNALEAAKHHKKTPGHPAQHPHKTDAHHAPHKKFVDKLMEERANQAAPGHPQTPVIT